MLMLSPLSSLGGRDAPGRARPAAAEGEEITMPEVTIQMVEGRTLEQKRELARRVTDLIVEVCGVDPSAVLVVFNENKREDKAKGGVLFSDR
jgi:4-oxalocrotonate tautomerase